MEAGNAGDYGTLESNLDRIERRNPRRVRAQNVPLESNLDRIESR